MAFTYPYPRPAVTTDAVVFAIRDGRLTVCLVERRKPPFEGRWALPGGFLGMAERAEAGARRELREETGLTPAVLVFLGAYDEPERDPRGRTLSLAYLGVAGPDAQPRGGDDAARAEWMPALGAPPLAFDHEAILGDALEGLRVRGRRSAILFRLLPERFTMDDATSAFRATYGQAFDAEALRKRCRALGLVGETGRADDLLSLPPEADNRIV